MFTRRQQVQRTYVPRHASGNVTEGEPEREGTHSRRPTSLAEIRAEVTADMRKGLGSEASS
jgi:hypothetical protein